MAIEFNSTLNQFVNWANQDGIVKTDLVHVTKTQGATGDAKITVAANKNDGIGFAAWQAARKRSAMEYKKLIVVFAEIISFCAREAEAVQDDAA